jgi:hypothetical protein
VSRGAALVLTLLGAVAGPARAQDDPATVTRAVLAADSAGDWPTLLRLAHPDALRQFRSLQVLQLRLLGDTASRPGQAAADSSDSTQHREFTRRRIEAQRAILDSVYHVRDVETLARLAPDSVAARWMRAARVRADTARAPVPRASLVGVVRAGDTLAYAVVVRSVPRPPGPLPEPLRDVTQQETHPEVMVLRRTTAGWRSMLDGTLLSEEAVAEDPLGGD